MDPGYKVCPKCANPCHTGALECPDCGHVFRIQFNSPVIPVYSPSPSRVQPPWPWLCGLLALMLFAVLLIDHRRQETVAAPAVPAASQQAPQVSAPRDNGEAALEWAEAHRQATLARELAQEAEQRRIIAMQQQMVQAERTREAMIAAQSVTYRPPQPARNYQYVPQPPPVVWHANPSTAVVAPPGVQNPLTTPRGLGNFNPPVNYNPGGVTLYH